MNSFLDIAKHLSVRHNVSFNVYDELTGRLVQHHEGHNMATNSMLSGIGHYLLGDGVLNQGYEMLRHWVPQYISLGTMGLYSQELDAAGLPSGIGYTASTTPEEEITNFKQYLSRAPGYGADGYDPYLNNQREYLGIGPVFKDRPLNGVFEKTINTVAGQTRYRVEDSYFIDYLVSVLLNGVDITNTVTLRGMYIQLSTAPTTSGQLLEVTYVPQGIGDLVKTVDCELVSDTFPRSPIEYRKLITEEKAEIPGTIDIVYSAMISTGALKQFREEGKDYVLVTEAGLWSRKFWPTDSNGKNDYASGDNGLLAGYRIAPAGVTIDDMDDAENRQALKREILRVGYNQVVQIVWKLQLGSIEEYGGWQSHPRERD